MLDQTSPGSSRSGDRPTCFIKPHSSSSEDGKWPRRTSVSPTLPSSAEGVRHASDPPHRVQPAHHRPSAKQRFSPSPSAPTSSSSPRAMPTNKSGTTEHYVVDSRKPIPKTIMPIKLQYLDCDLLHELVEQPRGKQRTLDRQIDLNHANAATTLTSRTTNEKGAQIGDPDELLAQLQATESLAAKLRGRLKNILTQALYNWRGTWSSRGGLPSP